MVDHDTLDKIIQMLEPHMSTELKRRIWLDILFTDEKITPDIDCAGAPRQATTHIAIQLINYGEISQGIQAIIQLLDLISREVGHDQQTRIRELQEQISIQLSSKSHERLGAKNTVVNTYLNHLEREIDRYHTEHFVELFATSESQEKQQTVISAVSQYEKCVITGDGGAGKTQTLYHLLLQAIDRKRNNSTAPLPFFVKLSQWNATEDTVQSFIKLQWQRYGLDSLGDLFNLLSEGNVVLYADGINEIRVAEYTQLKSLFKWIEKETRYIILTCRFGDYKDYQNKLAFDLPFIEIQSLDEAQIKHIAQARIGNGKLFLKKLQEANIFALAQNPFLLSSLLEIVESGETLPTHQGSLFEKILDKRVRSEFKKESINWKTLESFDEWKHKYAKMVFRYGQGNAVRIPNTETTKYLTDDDIGVGVTLGIIERTDKGISFTHQRWAEYFAAVYLSQHLDELPQFVQKPYFNSYPQERKTERPSQPTDQPIILLSGMTTSVNDVIMAILETDPWLAAMCIASANKVSHEIGEKVLEALLNELRAKTKYVHQATVLAFTHLGKRYVVSLDVELRKDDAVTRNAIIQALGLIGDRRAVPTLRVMLESIEHDEHLETRTHIVEALRLIGDPESFPILISFIDQADGSYEYREQAFYVELAITLGTWKVAEAIDSLIQLNRKGKGPEVDKATIKAIGMIGVVNENVKRFLLSQLGSEPAVAAEALAILNIKEAIEPLLEEFHKQRGGEAIVKALYSLSVETFEDFIAQNISSDSAENRAYVGKIIGWVENIKYLHHLKQLLKDISPQVRANAINSLTVFKNYETVSAIAEMLFDQSTYVCDKAATALEKINWAEYYHPSNEEQIRYHVARGTNGDWSDIREKFGKSSIEYIYPLLKSDDGNVANVVAKNLEQMGWIPISSEEKAWFFAAKGEFDACIDLGDYMIPVLTRKLRSKGHASGIHKALMQCLIQLNASEILADYFHEALYKEPVPDTWELWEDWDLFFDDQKVSNEIPFLIPMMIRALFDSNDRAMNLAKRFITRYTELLDEFEDEVVAKYFIENESVINDFINYVIKQGGIDVSSSWLLVKSAVVITSQLIESIAPTRTEKDTKIAAIRMLSEIPDDLIVDTLHTVLKNSDDTDLRIEAIKALAKRKTPEIISLLINTLRDKNRNVAYEAQEHLSWSGLNAVPALRTALADDNPQIQAGSIRALGKILEHQTEEPKKRLRSNSITIDDELFEDPHVKAEREARQQTVEKERRDLAGEVAQQLTSYLSNQEEDVQLAAIEAIKLIQESETLKLLVPLLKNGNPIVRARVATALGELEYFEAISEIQLLLSDKLPVSIVEGIAQSIGFLELEPPVLRVCDYAIQSLLNFDQNVILPTIKKVLHGDDNLLKAHAINAIKHLHKSSKISWLDYHQPSSDDKKYNWQEIIHQLEEQEIIKQLDSLLADSSPMADENMASDWASSFYDFCLISADNTIPDEELQGLRDSISQLQFFWSLPVGYYAIQALSVIRTPKAIQLILSTITSPIIYLRASAIEKLANWLISFPDSGWSSSHPEIEANEETEALRQEVIDQLIPLLNDRTLVNQNNDNELSISKLVAEALYTSGVKRALEAVEKWRSENNTT